MTTDVSITVDSAAMIEALQGRGLTDAIKARVRVAARVSAEHIRDEAKARLHRQLLGGSTGQTEAGIIVKADRSGFGWVVDAGRAYMPSLPLWIETGTKQGKPRSHTAAPRPFFYVSARLEQTAHLERVSAAVQVAINERGLGDDAQRPASPGGVGLL